MSTTEEVFTLYEKNSGISEPIIPIRIGDSSVRCRFKTKCYIRPGEECPICFEQIKLKKDAYLTGCGHSFHRECLLKTFDTKWKQKLFCTLKCPMCRSNLGFPELLERYPYNTPINHLDQLENFWFTLEFLLPHFCTNIKPDVHYLGMNKTCKKCKIYVENG